MPDELITGTNGAFSVTYEIDSGDVDSVSYRLVSTDETKPWEAKAYSDGECVGTVHFDTLIRQLENGTIDPVLSDGE